jgi:hypothetical protein
VGYFSYAHGSNRTEFILYWKTANERALKIYDESLFEDPSNAQAWYKKGNVFNNLYANFLEFIDFDEVLSSLMAICTMKQNCGWKQ